MTFLKQNWVKIGLGVLFLGGLFFVKGWGYNSFYNYYTNSYRALSGEIIWPTERPDDGRPLVRDSSLGAWLNNIYNLPLDDWDKDGKCLEATQKQINYLKSEKLSEQFTFDKYKATDVLTGKLADLDVKNNKYASTYRTMLRDDLDKKGLNFAGHYSIVSVGMTGMGDSYYIVDRTNGKAYPFPYWAYTLDFEKDSNLIIMDSKERILGQMRDFISYSDNCAFALARNSTLVEQKPFYFLWENNELKLLGPADIKPPINGFWEAYF